MIYYRKYRPQTLEEIVGQSHISTLLLKAHSTNHLSHAYLFCGPRGTGKTSTARILAKMVNCENQSTDYSLPSTEKLTESTEVGSRKSEVITIPCNKCSSCLSITDGSNLDLIEIDAASNRGIDDIRELRDKIKLAPSSSKKKVYIIDEVHMLTTEAFNALLKTLEEPPEHALFILATTDPQKIPQTILSRVQRLDFSPAKEEDLLTALKKAVEGEKLDIADSVLKLIAKKSEGSFRDSLKILDQLASSGEKITEELAEQIYKTGKFEDNLKLLTLIAQKDAKGALELVSEIVEKGISLKEFINANLYLLRVLLLIKNNAAELEKKDIEEEKYISLLGLSQKITNNQIINQIENFQKALEKSKFVSVPTLPLEVAVVESISSDSQIRSDKIRNPATPESIFIVRHSGDELSSDSRIQEDPGQARMTIQSESTKDDEIKVTSPISDAAEIVVIKDKWGYILETIKPSNFSLEALLKQSKIVNFESNTLILEVPYSFHKRILEAPKSRNLMESVLGEVLGKPAKVSTVVGQRPIRIEELANVEVAADDEIIQIAADIFNS